MLITDSDIPATNFGSVLESVSHYDNVSIGIHFILKKHSLQNEKEAAIILKF